jgi:hypothetical protein
MRVCIFRLSTISAQAEAALRIITAFDQLIAQHADIGDVVQATSIAECNAGLSDPQHSLLVHAGADGREIQDTTTTAFTMPADPPGPDAALV